MDLLPYCVIALLIVAVVVVVIRLISVRRALRDINGKMNDILATDTNTLISVSSNDKIVCLLADDLNVQLRQIREERRRLQNGDREIKESVTNIAHDIRTPLTAISGYLQLLDKEEKSDTVSEYIGMIKNRTEALKSLTEELFRYSVLSSESELVFETVDVGAVLEQSIAAAYGILTQKNIEPEIDISSVRTERELDRSALCRIFENILSNAAKYSDGDLKVEMSEKGEIIFSNHASELDSVAVARLFDRFYTVETGRKSTGLGLSIAKMLTERMNGRISAKYENGQIFIIIEFN